MFCLKTPQRAVSLFCLPIVLTSLIGITGCSHNSASGGPEISTASFRADTSKMTEADKQRMKALSGGGSAPTTTTTK